MHGRVIVITGASGGIGRAAARAVALKGATVVLAVRDAEKGELVRAAIEAETGDADRAQVVLCDLASFSSVRAAAERIAELHPRIDVLVNNAGLIADRRTVTEDGHELTFQVNHLSHFLLTHLLLDQLGAAAPSLVINVSSDAHRAAWRGFDFDDPESTRRWTAFGAYSQTKLANIVFATAASERWGGDGVYSCAFHPGMVRSGFGRDGWGTLGSLWERLAPKLTPEEGADTLVWLAMSETPAEFSGRYYYRRAPRRPARPARDVDAQRRLWRLSQELTGPSAREHRTETTAAATP